MNTVKKYFQLSRADLGTSLIIQLAAFVIGIIIVLSINTFINDDADYAAMGSFFAMIIVIIVGALRGNSSHLYLAVSMGETRKSFLIYETLWNAVYLSIGIIVCRLLYWAETGLYSVIWRGYENASILFEKMFTLPIIGLIIVIVVGTGMFLSMLKVRFGNKAFAFFWAGIWILFMLVSRAISSAAQDEATVLAKIGSAIMNLAQSAPPYFWLGIGYVFAVILGAVSVLGLRKVEIRI